MAKIPVAPMGGGIEIVTGTYTGDGAESRAITLGFRAKAILVFERDGGVGDKNGGLALDGIPAQTTYNSKLWSIIEITDTGFSVAERSSSPTISTNSDNQIYYYLAFK